MWYSWTKSEHCSSTFNYCDWLTILVSLSMQTSKTSSNLEFLNILFLFVHICIKTLATFTCSCCLPHWGWRHLRWSPRSLCRTCSSPGCCTCQSLKCSHQWWWSWRTCPTQTSRCSAHQMWSLCHSSARWPLVQGLQKYYRSNWGPKEDKRDVCIKSLYHKEEGWCLLAPETLLRLYLALLYSNHIRKTSCYSCTTWVKQLHSF